MFLLKPKLSGIEPSHGGVVDDGEGLFSGFRLIDIGGLGVKSDVAPKNFVDFIIGVWEKVLSHKVMFSLICMAGATPRWMECSK